MQMVVEKLVPEDHGIRVSVHYNEVRLSKRDSVTASFRLIMDNVVEHLRYNIEEARGGDVEGTHQLRVGIRRARTLLRLYQPLLPSNKVRRFDRRLRRFGHIFGAARDWDVFLVQTLDAAWPEADVIRQRAVEQQQYHHDHVNALLEQQQFSKLLDRMTDWGRSLQFPDQPIGEVAPKLLDRMLSQVSKRKRSAQTDDPKALHSLRRSVKRLRYASEFFAWMFRRKRVHRYTQMLKRAQDRMGEHNDAIITEALLLKIDMQGPMRSIMAERQNATRKQAKGPSGLKSKRFW